MTALWCWVECLLKCARRCVAVAASDGGDVDEWCEKWGKKLGASFFQPYIAYRLEVFCQKSKNPSFDQNW